MHYLSFLRRVHELLEPETYLEVGVHTGGSMAQSRCRSVGIDPAFAINREIDCSLALFRTTSDEYFARDEPLAPTGGAAFDLAFIDGLHLFEFALRDFINVERHCSPKSLVIFDDMLPRNVDEAARQRHSYAWTGDVYSVVEVLARYRPDLTVVPIGTTPTGLLLVFGLDPQNTTLADNYDAIMAEFRRPDPQPVPPALMDRLAVVAPERILESGFWSVLHVASRDDPVDQVRSRLAGTVRSDLGVAFGPSA